MSHNKKKEFSFPTLSVQWCFAYSASVFQSCDVSVFRQRVVGVSRSRDALLPRFGVSTHKLLVFQTSGISVKIGISGNAKQF